jgi:hypothetical protein
MRISGMPKCLVGIENVVELEAIGDQQLRVDPLGPQLHAEVSTDRVVMVTCDPKGPQMEIHLRPCTP